jgi:putative FmdB family regulatory protein
VPTYQYACTSCEHRLEAVQSFSDEALTGCPECQGTLRKVFSAVGIVFKGSGFYRTDSRTAPKSEAVATAGAGGADSTASGSTPAKSESSASTPAGGDSGSSGGKNGSTSSGGSSSQPSGSPSSGSSSKGSSSKESSGGSGSSRGSGRKPAGAGTSAA